MFTKLKLRVLILSLNVFLSVFGQNCDEISSSSYFCDDKDGFHQEKCKTFAIFRASSRYSSPSNLSSDLGISPSELAQANGLSADTDFFSNDQPILIPIECKCNSDKFFEAEVRKATIKGESFYDITEAFEGLTNCKAIRDKNPSISPWNLEERINLLVPLKCGCPSSVELRKFLLSYPVKEGDTLVELALMFNVTVESIVFANDKYSKAGFKQENRLLPLSTLLIPVEGKPSIRFLAKPEDSNMSIQVRDKHKRRNHKKRKMIGIYVAIAIFSLLTIIAIGVAAFFLLKRKKRRQDSIKNIDVEQQQLSLSVRTTSDKKVSFEGSQYNFDDPSAETTTPRKMLVENYSFEELQKATEDFNVSNLIEGSVFHGRLKGKNLSIKRTSSEFISKIDVQLFHERIHRHPNLLRFLGTCVMDGSDSFIVHDYAKNGSLKDWIHGGLAIKSHFIASCSCFLTWNQRLKICLDIATALQYMHHIINPSYVHRHIKSRNIFLDEEFNAKLGNFGMANCVENEHQWNKGYLAPEFINKGLISPSIDVFAYGVVLLEVLSGKPPIRRDDDNFIKVTDEIKSILESEDAEELKEWMDSSLGENYSFDGAVMLANLARSCVEDDPSSRPNAGEIVEKLLRLVQELPECDQFNVSESSCKPLVVKKGEEFI
ncbi:hypothetical protein BUALT_Bualt04G0172100 [Buddleja alternifolia]|uniref:Uncharacterized protein n=1 Tax=Buddleja alternifolia TaxID=168488 RepID=A0AAV6XPP6_9LAMI|nr:hypothetical protein BUALT_Bualt04G0172100 [Buddleja alternifolia]